MKAGRMPAGGRGVGIPFCCQRPRGGRIKKDRKAMHKILDKLREEFLAVLPPTIFFFVTLHIVATIRVLIARGGASFEPLSTISIAVAALILGKAVLIADLLPAINRYPGKPLIYNVLWKTAIYWLIASLIHYLERLFDFTREAGGIVAGNEKLL